MRRPAGGGVAMGGSSGSGATGSGVLRRAGLLGLLLLVAVVAVNVLLLNGTAGDGGVGHGTGTATDAAQLALLLQQQREMLATVRALHGGEGGVKAAPAGGDAGNGGGASIAADLERLAFSVEETRSMLQQLLKTSGGGSGASGARDGSGGDGEGSSGSAAGAVGTVPVRRSSKLAVWQGSSKAAKLERKLAEYTKIHNDITSKKRDPRYVECVLINGWGNILQEAVSCMLFGLVTDRAVLLNWGPVRGYMPFRDFVDGDGTHLPFDGYNMQHIAGMQRHLITRHEIQCLNFDSFADKPYVQIHLTYDWYAPYILSNPHHGDSVMSWLPDNYFQIIFHYLFKLHPDLQREVDAVKKNQFGGYNVGIQIRYAKPKTEKGKIDHKGMPIPALELYTQMAEQISRFQEAVPYADVVWFLATQNTELVARLRAEYGDRRIAMYNGTIATTFDNNREAQRSALITWWLLGECDDLITTELSSYGITASARAGIPGIVCNAEKFCTRRISPTPCQDTKFPVDIPQQCLLDQPHKTHQWAGGPESHCGFFKHRVYSSKEYIEAQKE